MKFSPLHVFLIILFKINFGFSQKTNHTIANGYVKCDDGPTITVLELLAKRTVLAPHLLYNPRIPLFCQENTNNEIDKLVQKHREDDMSNIHAISNSFCSHSGGWIELNPGECSAGGPPPICTANHWKKANIADAIESFEKEQRKIASVRTDRIKQIQQQSIEQVGICWINELKKQEEKQLTLNLSITPEKYSSGNESNYYNLPQTKFPCMSGCPPAYSCVNGFCERTVNSNSTIGSAENSLKDKAQKSTQNKSVYAGELYRYLSGLGEWGKKYLNGLSFLETHSIVMEAGYNFVTSATMSNSGGLSDYLHRIEQINNSVNRLESLYKEEINSLKTTYTRSLTDVKQDVMEERKKINFQLQALNLSRREVRFDCKGCCKQMLDYQHSSIIDYASKLINFNYLD